MTVTSLVFIDAGVCVQANWTLLDGRSAHLPQGDDTCVPGL